jgi:hypothetical protein
MLSFSFRNGLLKTGRLVPQIKRALSPGRSFCVYGGAMFQAPTNSGCLGFGFARTWRGG